MQTEQSYIVADSDGSPVLVNKDGQRAEYKAASFIRARSDGKPQAFSPPNFASKIVADSDGRPMLVRPEIEISQDQDFVDEPDEKLLELEAKIRELETKNSDLETENADLESEVLELEFELDELDFFDFANADLEGVESGNDGLPD